MKRLILLALLLLPLTVTALPTVFDTATKLTFAAPTENTDDSPLTDLAGFKIYWRTDQAVYNDIDSQLFNDPTIIEILLLDITFPSDNDYFMVLTAVNSSGLESGFSTEVFVKKLGGRFYKDPNAGTVPAAPFNLEVR